MRTLIIFFLLATGLSMLEAQNPNQWRGNFRDGKFLDEEGLLKSWPEEGPKKLWSVNKIGDGYSSATSSGDMIFTTGMIDSTEMMSAFDMGGQLVWQTKYGTGWTLSYRGTRSTPTYEQGKIYIISGTGEAVCLDAEDGSILWKLDAREKFEGNPTMWGYSESPLVVDDMMIFTPGGERTTMVALNKFSGETIWVSESLRDSTAYVSPILIEHNGRKIISSILANYFFGVDLETGKLLWNFNYFDLKWRQTHYYSPHINCNSPLYHDGRVFITKGYDHKSAMLELDDTGEELELLWTDTILDVHFGHAIFHDQYIYGSNWINNRTGNWCCLNWETGDLMYETEWISKGAMLLADGMFYCLEEKTGNLALVEPSPDDFKIISSFRIQEGKGPYWAHPTIQGGVLYTRHGDYLMAYDLRKDPNSTE